MRGPRMRQKIVNKEGCVSSVKTLGMRRGVMYSVQVTKIEYLKFKFECSKVRFEWLKGQRSVIGFILFYFIFYFFYFFVYFFIFIYLFLFFLFSVTRWCLIRVRVQDGRGEAEVS